MGGLKEANYTLEGRIEKDVFYAQLSSHFEMGGGPPDFIGYMMGKIFNSRGSGTWTSVHPQGSSSGDYSSKKIK